MTLTISEDKGTENVKMSVWKNIQPFLALIAMILCFYATSLCAQMLGSQAHILQMNSVRYLIECMVMLAFIALVIVTLVIVTLVVVIIYFFSCIGPCHVSCHCFFLLCSVDFVKLLILSFF